MKRKIKIGLLGEDPTDTVSLSNLLKRQREFQHCIFKSALKNVRGKGLLTDKGLKMVQELWADEEYEFLVLVMDLDGFEDNIKLRKPIEDRFAEIQKVYPKQNLLLLNIQELEALILADIKTLDKNLTFTGDPMRVVSPKEFLNKELKKVKSKKTYETADAPDIFNRLDFESIKLGCRYFRDFIDTLEARLKTV